MKGRKRLPRHLKLVKGTLQPCRENKREPQPPPSVPAPAIELGSRESYWFGIVVGRLQAMHIGSAVDSEMVMLLATRLAEIEECDALIKEHGRTYSRYETIEVPNPKYPGPLTTEGKPTEPKMIVRTQRILKSNPAVSMRSEGLRHAQSLLAEVGLSITGRNRISVSDDDDPSPWDIFR